MYLNNVNVKYLFLDIGNFTVASSSTVVAMLLSIFVKLLFLDVSMLLFLSTKYYGRLYLVHF